MTVDDWIRLGNDVCREYRSKVDAIHMHTRARDATPEESREFDEALQGEIDGFKRLNAPPELAGAREAILDALELKQQASRAYAEAARNGADPSDADAEKMSTANNNFTEAVVQGRLDFCGYKG